MSGVDEGRIGAAAAGQHGVVTRSQLLGAGLSVSSVERRLRAGRYQRLHSGVYLVLPFRLPHTMEMAAVLASGPGATLSRLSAGRLLCLLPPVDGALVDVIGGSRKSRPGIRAHHVRHLPAKDRTVREGIPVTTPERTLVDIAGLVETRELESAVARALRAGLDASALTSRLTRNHRGVRALRAVLDAAGGPALTRSEAEEKFLALVRSASLPPPRCNVRVGSHEVDFLWPGARLVVEVDGYRHHGARSRFESDRRKDAELVAAGFTVLRVSWRQITEEGVATAVRIGQALARASERR